MGRYRWIVRFGLLLTHFTPTLIHVCDDFSRETKKGIGVEVAHFLGDGLYQADEIL